MTPASPHLFSNQKKSVPRLTHSPFLALRSPESLFSRFVPERQTDFFEMFDAKRLHLENAFGVSGGYGEPYFSDQKNERKVFFRREHEDKEKELSFAGFLLASPIKKTRERVEDSKVAGVAKLHSEQVLKTTQDVEVPIAVKRSRGRRAKVAPPEFSARRLSTGRKTRNFDIKTELSENSENKDGHRSSKGLKTLSHRVREIVAEKRKTSYKEVAEVLISETRSPEQPLTPREEQNIKRRVYDALNVLIAADILVKDQKVVYYKLFYEKGRNMRERSQSSLKTGSELIAKRDCLSKTANGKQEALLRKKEELKSILVKCLAIRDIVERNATDPLKHPRFVTFPFIMVKPSQQEHLQNQILLDMNRSNSQLLIQSNSLIEISTDLDFVKLFDIAKSTQSSTQAKIHSLFGFQSPQVAQLLGHILFHSNIPN